MRGVGGGEGGAGTEDEEVREVLATGAFIMERTAGLVARGVGEAVGEGEVLATTMAVDTGMSKGAATTIGTERMVVTGAETVVDRAIINGSRKTPGPERRISKIIRRRTGWAASATPDRTAWRW